MGKEIWKNIKGYERYYKISTIGTVMNKKTGKLISVTKGCQGFYFVGLYNDIVGRKIFPIHRLVAAHFIRNPDKKRFVWHKDKNRQNNNVDNLEWTTERAECDSSNKTFYNKIKKDTATGCWIWQAAKYPNGYGLYSYKKTLTGAHRASYRIHIGEIPDKMSVCHKCDNKACVNPDHLFVGTHLDNMQDMVSKGRSRRGIQGKRKHPSATSYTAHGCRCVKCTALAKIHFKKHRILEYKRRHSHIKKYVGYGGLGMCESCYFQTKLNENGFMFCDKYEHDCRSVARRTCKGIPKLKKAK